MGGVGRRVGVGEPFWSFRWLCIDAALAIEGTGRGVVVGADGWWVVSVVTYRHGPHLRRKGEGAGEAVVKQTSPGYQRHSTNALTNNVPCPTPLRRS